MVTGTMRKWSSTFIDCLPVPFARVARRCGQFHDPGSRPGPASSVPGGAAARCRFIRPPASASPGHPRLHLAILACTSSSSPAPVHPRRRRRRHPVGCQHAGQEPMSLGWHVGRPRSRAFGGSGSGWREEPAVSLNRRQLRNLRGIEAELAASDPGLHAFFVSFTSGPACARCPARCPARTVLPRGRPGCWPSCGPAGPRGAGGNVAARPTTGALRTGTNRDGQPGPVRGVGHHLQRVMTHKRAATIMAWWPNTTT